MDSIWHWWAVLNVGRGNEEILTRNVRKQLGWSASKKDDIKIDLKEIRTVGWGDD
jgi:hypothetical protein